VCGSTPPSAAGSARSTPWPAPARCTSSRTRNRALGRSRNASRPKYGASSASTAAISPGNIVHTINSARGRTVTIDVETARLLGYAETLFELSEGRFDITSGALRRAWRFDGSDRVPAVDEVSALMQRVGWQRARWNRNCSTLRLEMGMEIDFGGIGKEYAVERAAALLRGSPEPCLINLGGDLAVTRPGTGGRPWRVGIEALDTNGKPARVLEVRRGALATSGDARRFLLKDGHRYGHVLDARTGLAGRGRAAIGHRRRGDLH
jgi:thiamine biosynthesis lipoprotein